MKEKAARAVNTELIELYWRIGDYLHRKIESDGWAKGTVVQLAAYIAHANPACVASRRKISGACGSSS